MNKKKPKKKSSGKWIVNLEQWIFDDERAGRIGPFDKLTPIDIIRRDGRVEYNVPSGCVERGTSTMRFFVYDRNTGEPYGAPDDILLYRLHDPSDMPGPKKAKPKIGKPEHKGREELAYTEDFRVTLTEKGAEATEHQPGVGRIISVDEATLYWLEDELVDYRIPKSYVAIGIICLVVAIGCILAISIG